MITEIQAWQTTCAECRHPIGVPCLTRDDALSQANVLVKVFGYQRDGERITCPGCAAKAARQFLTTEGK